MSACFYNKLTAFAWAGAGTYAGVVGGSVNESVGWLKSHQNGNVAPICRAIGDYDCEPEVSYEAISTPAAKSTAAASCVYSLSGTNTDGTTATVGVTVVTCLIGETKINMDGGPDKPFVQSTKFGYVGSSLNPITVA